MIFIGSQVLAKVHIIGIAAHAFRAEWVDADAAFADLFQDTFV